jgi:hypothetical protein
MKPTNHAARLREMAAERQAYADSYSDTVCGMGEHPGREAAALLAGAEALEAVAKLRAFADELTAQDTPVLPGIAYQIDRLLPKKEKSDG